MDIKPVIIDMQGKTYGTGYGLWQYDYGRTLRIQGLDLPTAVEIHFSLRETGGESKSRVGVSQDGVTDVVIPDSMLEAGDATADYDIYAFIYLTDEESGKTAYKIRVHVRSRPRPEAFDTPEDAELFRDAIAAVNEAADRAGVSEENAAESEQKAAKHLETTEELAQQVAEDKDTVVLQAREVATNTEEATRLAQQTNSNAEQVASDTQQVASDKEQVTLLAEQTEENAKTVADLAQEVNNNTNRVEELAQQVSEDAQEVTENAQQVAENTQQVSEKTAKVEELIQKTEQYAEAAKRGVQADLSINDENNPSYVRNRTHWVDGVELVEILPECQPIYDEGMFLVTENVPTFELGKTYVVNWNGTEYTCVAVDMSVMADDGSEVYALGDLTNFGGTGNGEPFAIIVRTSISGTMMAMMALDGSTEVTLSISTFNEKVHKLDNKYLDLEWLPTSEKTQELLPSTTVTMEHQAASKPYIYAGIIDLGFMPNFTPGDKILVVFDGVDYEMTIREDGSGSVYVANTDFRLDATGTGLTVLSSNEHMLTHTVAIFYAKYEKIPEKFIPNTAYKVEGSLINANINASVNEIYLALLEGKQVYLVDEVTSTIAPCVFCRANDGAVFFDYSGNAVMRYKLKQDGTFTSF